MNLYDWLITRATYDQLFDDIEKYLIANEKIMHCFVYLTMLQRPNIFSCTTFDGNMALAIIDSLSGTAQRQL